MTLARLIEAVDLRPIETAPRDGSYIIGVTRHNLEDLWIGQAARPFVIWHMGRTSNLGLDMGWALYPGMGVGDDWFAGWVPLPFNLDRAAILRALEQEGR